MAWHMQYRHFQIADLKALAVGKQLVEIRSVAWELVTKIEQLSECLLHSDDVLSDRDLPSQLLLQIGRGGEMIRMGVGFQLPVNVQLMLLDVCNDSVRS